jgi:hypothetical protein
MRNCKAEQESSHWQAAIEAVIIAAEDRAPILHARIGMLRALNHGKPSPVRRYQGRAAIRARFGRLSISSPL